MIKLSRVWTVQFLAIVLLLTGAIPAAAASDAPAVHAILFYSPSCPHCHEVITKVLPPLQKQYGEQLVIAGINVDTEQGQEVYRAAVSQFSIPAERIGVPAMIVAGVVLVGSVEIPEQFPGLIRQGLDRGGDAWPAIPGLSPDLLVPLPTESLSAFENFMLDPVANTIAVIILAGMIVCLGVTYGAYRRWLTLPAWPTWSIPILSLAGLVIAGYLSYVEITQTSAICGPVGNCNLVQQSPFARFLGIPVGIWGIAGYAFLLLVWMVKETNKVVPRGTLTRIAFIITAAGVLFSIYLTFLEPFVIGASCAWCLSSAIVMTLLMLSSASELFRRPVRPGKRHA